MVWLSPVAFADPFFAETEFGYGRLYMGGRQVAGAVSMMPSSPTRFSSQV